MLCASFVLITATVLLLLTAACSVLFTLLVKLLSASEVSIPWWTAALAGVLITSFLWGMALINAVVVPLLTLAFHVC